MRSLQTRMKKSKKVFQDLSRQDAFLILASLVCCFLFTAVQNVYAADCPDNDNDGFVVCGGCDVPEGKTCGDCDDSNANINPDAAEICGDGLDNNCDEDIDFGAGEVCTLGVPIGCTEPSEEEPCCITNSVFECNDQGTGVICPEPGTGLEQPIAENAYSEECHDGIDNDCDTLIDMLDPDCFPVLGEQCNGLDDDYDEQIDEDFSIGEPCTSGQGACERTGVFVCADESSAICSASPGDGLSEDTPGTGRCVDGIDNDCDELIDVNDPGCQGVEVCDGLDNDGNGAVDELFPDLNTPCTTGVGACEANGTRICTPDGQGTMCSATPLLASIEGPDETTCSDGIDNDCDELTDMEDPDCSSADFLVSCALPYYQGEWRPGFNSCVGLHRIFFTTNVDLDEHPYAVLSAELIAMDEDGKTLASIPVKSGDLARLASRVDKEDWIVETLGTNHKVFAPRPVLHVSLDDGKNKAEAFCSNIPFINLIEPKGKVVTESEGDTTRLFAAIPLLNPSRVEVQVDGVDIFSALGITNPATCRLTQPCSGTVEINGQDVEISDLAIQTSPVWLPGVNTLNMRLGNLGCGEHIFLVNGVRRLFSFPNTPDEQCLEDDFGEKGTSSGLAIKIDFPEEYNILDEEPVQVIGSACSGREISGIEINGKLVDVSAQILTMGDGETSGDKYEITIDSTHFLTDLSDDLASGDTNLGTFDLGTNRLSAMVTDDLGNRSFDTKIFAIGDVVMPDFSEALQISLKNEALKKIEIAAESAAGEIDNAFVIGMTEEAVQDLFDERCKAAATEFVNNLQANIVNQVVDERKVEVTACSCDPKVKTRITGFSADPNDVSCPVNFLNNKIEVTMNLPTVTVDLGVKGSCRTTFLGACIAKTNVSGSTHSVLSGAKVEFDITEGQLLGTQEPTATFIPPTASDPPTGNIHISIGCLASICDFFLSPIAAIVNGIAGDRLIPVLGFGQTIDVNFEAKLGTSKPDPIQLGEIKVDEQEVQGTGQKLEGILSDVQITPAGLVAGLKGKFETLSVDPEIELTPGAVETPAPLPAFPVPDAGDVFVALADDTFNQFFASMAVSGRLKTGCTDTGKTVGDLLPVDCASLSVGHCSVDDTVSCKTDSDCATGTCVEEPLKTAIAKGACYAFKGDDCSSLPIGQKLVCMATEKKLADINISAEQPLLFCARQDIPPRLLIQDESATPDIETAVRLNDLSIALVVDRDGNGELDGSLSSTHKCLAEGAPVVGDCNFFCACLDLNIETGMQLANKHCQEDPSILCNDNTDCASVGGLCVDVCDSGEPGFVTRVKSIKSTVRALGVVCGGATTPGDDELLANTSGEETTMEILLENANRFSPPACIEGLNLGGFLEFKNPKLFVIDVDGDPSFDDYLGITGELE